MRDKLDQHRRCRALLAILLVAASAATTAAPALADDQDDRMALYAAALIGSEIAEKRCDGMRRNDQALKDLKFYAGIFEIDGDAVRQDTQRFRNDIEAQYTQLGTAAWCEAVWKALGPNGEIAKNVLERVKVPPPVLRK